MSFPFSLDSPYPSRRQPLFARNVVATSQPLAAQAGLRMMQAGGNAVDAALAAAIALTVTEPVSNGLGSDLFAILWDGEGLVGLNASGRAPAAWTPERFAGLERMPKTGWDSVTVPGAVSGWVALSRRYGKLPFADLFAPAIAYARRGHPVAPIVAYKWAKQADVLRAEHGFAATFLPDGRAPRAGERFVCEDMARAMEAIAATGGDAFYRGALAQAMVEHAARHGGVMTREDLARHTADWVDPVGLDYRGWTAHEIPPNGQGIAALMALGILESFDLRALEPDSPPAQHLQIEAMKLAFADIYHHVADPRAMRVRADELLDKAYLRSRARLIDRSRATDFGHGTPGPGGTVYLAAADERGMMVSLIQSNYMGFGSGVVVEGTGISLQNRGAGFSLDPAHPNVVAGGKRPFHTIIPGFLTREGAPVCSFGVMGGPIQPQGHVQTLVRMLDHGQGPQAALDAPRWKVDRGLAIDLEGSARPGLREALCGMGHTLTAAVDSYMDFGAGQVVWRTEDGYVAASDPRRDGQAVGF